MNLYDRLPNFLILGAAKAGTTSLFESLKEHPQVYFPFNKETMFFSHDDNFQRGAEWYVREYYRPAAAFPARGDATPHYLYWSEKVAPRIRELLEHAAIKFIVIFRDPVARSYSWYWNMVREGREDLPFMTALEQESSRLVEDQDRLHYAGSMTYGYKRGSCYASALKPFLDIFPSDNFHFLLQEDLARDFPGTMKNLLTFLNLDPGIDLNPHTSNQATMPRSMRVQTWLRRQSSLRELFIRFLPLRLRHTVKTRLLKANARPSRYPRLDPDLEAKLRIFFEPEVRQLASIINRDLSAWLPR